MHQAQKTISTCALLVLGGGLVYWDRHQSTAGLTMLVCLVGSLGSLHGALDVLLIIKQFSTHHTRIQFTLAYLVTTLLTASALIEQPAWALMLLLLLSIWHFGEAFHGEPNRWLRWVRGGGPVLMPALINRPALYPLVSSTAAHDAATTTMLWRFWTALAWVWLALVLIWLGWTALNGSPLARLWHRGWGRGKQHITLVRPSLEILGLTLLYSVASPLMAFALFFGIYHAGGHILRVSGLYKKKSSPPKMPFILMIMATTLLLTFALVWGVWQHISHTELTDTMLPTVIVALTAVSVPHVVLISWWARHHPRFGS
jgi:beta-carotene 15,15'-dioxygenase